MSASLAPLLVRLLAATLALAPGLRAVDEHVLRLDEVTDAELAITADGTRLVFPLLGDLVTVGVEGGAATVLTEGPAYDRCPLPQEDGSLCFVSDREGFEDAVYQWQEGGAPIRRGPLTGGVPSLALGGRPTRLDGGRAWTLGADWVAGDADLGEWRRLLDTRGPGLAGVLSGDGPDRLVLRPIEATETRIATEGRVLWGGVDAEGERAVVGLEIAEGASPIAEEVHVIDLASGEVLLRERSGPARRDRAPRPCRPAFHGGRAWYPLGGRIRVFDPELNASTDLPWTAELRVWTPHAPFRLRERSVRRVQSSSSAEWSPSAVDAFDVSAGDPRLVFSAAGDLWLSEGDDPPFRLTEDAARQDHPRFDPRDETRILFSEDGMLGSVDDLGDGLHSLGVVVNGPFEPTEDGEALLLAGFGGATLLDRETGARRPLLATPGLPRSWGLHPTPGTEGEVLHCGGTPVQLVSTPRDPPDAPGRVLTRLTRPPSRPAASADGAWLAFLRDGRAWLGRRGADVLGEEDFRAIGPVGVHGLRFDPGSERLWLLAGTEALGWKLSAGEIDLRRALDLRLSGAAPADALVLTSVDVYPGTGDRLLRDQRLEIADGLVRTLRPESQCAPPAEGARVIDGEGCVAIPGLIDAHVHSPSMALTGAVAWGVTWMRDVGGSDPASWTTEERARVGDLVPRLVLAGEIFEGATPFWGDGFHVIEDAAEALRLLDHRDRRGVDLVKVYPSLPRSLRSVVLAEAARRRLPSTGHADDLRMIVTSLFDGIGCFEHVPSSPIHGDVIALMASAGVAWCPTLCVMGGGDLVLRTLDGAGEPEDWADPRFRAAVPDWHLAGSRARPYYAWSSEENLRALVDERCAGVVRAFRAGVPILAGSDAPNSNCFHGPGTHWEMALLVRGGMTSAEALRAASSVPAAHLGLPELGRLAPGCVADLVLLEADPLEDIGNSRRIRTVIRDGRPHTPEAMLDLPSAGRPSRD